MTHLGADISFYDDENETPEMVNFEKMAAEGIEFLFIRGGQNLWHDPDFLENWKRSKGLIPRGLYWFLDDRIDPEVQVQILFDMLKSTGDFGELPIVMDFETTPDKDNSDGQYSGWHNLYKALAKCERLMPDKDFMIYTGFYFWRKYGPSYWLPTQKASLDYFLKYPAWIANYDTITDEYFQANKVPAPWKNNGGALIRQYTQNGDGKRYGSERIGFDLNRFLGDETQWLDFIGAWETPLPPVEPPVDLPVEPPVIEPPINVDEPADNFPIKGKLLDGMNLRTSPVVNDDNQIGYLFKNEKVSGVLVPEGANSWLEMDAGSFGNLYVAEVHSGRRFIETDTTPAPPPSQPEIARFIVAPSEGYWYIPGDYPYRQVTFEGVGDARRPMPQTHVLYKVNSHPLWTPLNEKWQWFIHDLLKVANPGQSDAYYLAAYEDLVADHRAFTDLHDKDGHTDYVLGRNLGLNKPYYWKTSITCKMNMIRDDYGLDITKDPPRPEDVFEDKALVHWANQVYPEYLSNGMPKVVHFPQIKKEIDGKFEKTGTPIPYFKPPVPINHAGMIRMIPGVEYPAVNLERDQA